MLQLDVTFPDERTVSASERLDVFWNVDVDGIAAGAIDTTRPVNGTPLPVFPGETPGPYWLETPWLTGVWLGETRAPAAAFRTPPVCFGMVSLGAKVRDSLGNYQSDAIAETSQMVNSTPLGPLGLLRSTFAAGQQAFTFTPSPQVV